MSEFSGLLLLFIYYVHFFNAVFYNMKQGISIQKKIANSIGQNVRSALLGLHSFTGCDSVSAFAGTGKVKPFEMLINKKEYQLGAIRHYLKSFPLS